MIFLMLLRILYCALADGPITSEAASMLDDPAPAVQNDLQPEGPAPESSGSTSSRPADIDLEVPYCASFRNVCDHSYSFSLGYRFGYSVHTKGWYHVGARSERVVCWKVLLTKPKPLNLYLFAEDLDAVGVPRASDVLSSDGGTWQTSIHPACILTARPFHFVRYDGPGGVSEAAWSHSLDDPPTFVPGARASFMALGENFELLPAPATSLSCTDLRKGAGLVDFSFIGEIFPGVRLGIENSFAITCAREEQRAVAIPPSGCCLSNQPAPRPATPGYNVSLATTGPDFLCFRSDIHDLRRVLEPLAEVDLAWSVAGGVGSYADREAMATQLLMPNAENGARSYLLTDGCEMKVYTDADFKGQSIHLKNPNLFQNTTHGSFIPLGFDRSISSLQCRCPDVRTGGVIGGDLILMPPASVPCRLDLGACSGLVCSDGKCNNLDPWNRDQRVHFDWTICGAMHKRRFCPLGYIMCNSGACLPDPGTPSLQRAACERIGGGLRLNSDNCVYCDRDACYQRSITGKLIKECICSTLPESSNGPFAPDILQQALEVNACQKCVKYAMPAAVYVEPRTGVPEDQVCNWCYARGCPILDPRCAFCNECVH